MSFYQLFLANLKILYRDRAGVFWTLLMPLAIYIAISLLPVSQQLVPGTRYATYLLPGILAMVIMQGGIYGLAYWMVDLKGRGVVKRFLVTPIKKSELILSVIASRIVIMLLQVIVLTAVGVFFFGATFSGNVFSTLLFAVLGGTVFLLVGLSIATAANTYQAAAPLTAAVGLPFLFLSNIFYPLENLPHSLRVVGEVLPITYLANGLRTVYLQPFEFALIKFDFFMLIVWGLLIFSFVFWRFKFEE
jgi:ABC-2 type transport system permease protein